MASQPETRLKNRVLKDLKTLPYMWVLKTQERSRRGVPDLLISLGGQFIAIELKVKATKATPLQMVVLEDITMSGGLAFVVNTENWASIFQELKDSVGAVE